MSQTDETSLLNGCCCLLASLITVTSVAIVITCGLILVEWNAR